MYEKEKRVIEFIEKEFDVWTLTIHRIIRNAQKEYPNMFDCNLIIENKKVK